MITSVYTIPSSQTGEHTFLPRWWGEFFNIDNIPFHSKSQQIYKDWDNSMCICDQRELETSNRSITRKSPNIWAKVNVTMWFLNQWNGKIMNIIVLIGASLVAQMVKGSVCSVGDPGSTPGLGRSPGEGNGTPLQYSCLENPMDGGA